MLERSINYPCAIFDQTNEGYNTALKWVTRHLSGEQQITVWVSLKRILRNNDFLTHISKKKDIKIVTPREGFYQANGPVLAMYPDSNELADITNANGITALAVVQWADNLDTWIKEVNAEIIHTFDPIEQGKAFPYEEVEPALSPEVIEGLKSITQCVNQNNSITAVRIYKDITVRVLLRLYDANYALPPKRIAQWASAHGWSGRNSEDLANLAEKISSGSRPRTS